MLKDAEPVGRAFDVSGLKGTHRHFYERLDMPDNYVVLGDAVAHLNPRFGSGMTAAAFQVLPCCSMHPSMHHAMCLLRDCDPCLGQSSAVQALAAA